MTFLQVLHGRLEELVYKLTDNFCYSCYRVVEDEYCPTCSSDDFMRHLKGVGVEYGTDWVIDHWIEIHCTPVDGEELFEQLLDECYPEVKVGCCTFSPSEVMKELDPTCFRIGVQENLDGLAQDGSLSECNGEYYDMSDIEAMIDDLESGEEG